MKPQNDRGVVLLLVVVFGLILSVVGISTVQYSGIRHRSAENRYLSSRADIGAQNGLESLKSWISSNCINADMFPENVFGDRNFHCIYTYTGGSCHPYGNDVVALGIQPDNNPSVFISTPSKSLMGYYTLTATATITSGVSGSMDITKWKSMKIGLIRGGRFSRVGNSGDAHFMLNYAFPFLQADNTVVFARNQGEFEQYNPISKTFSPLPGRLADIDNSEGYIGHMAQLTKGPHSGQFLCAGWDSVYVNSHGETYGAGSQICDPFGVAPPFISIPMPMSIRAENSYCITLSTGGVLMMGSTGCSDVQLYNPDDDTYTAIPMITWRNRPSSILLSNGKVLITGGGTGVIGTGIPITASAELFDPVSNVFTPLPAMNFPRVYHSMTKLDNGKVLITGGSSTGSYMIPDGLADLVLPAEIFDPATNTFSVTGSLIEGMSNDVSTATLLPSGQVLLYGRRDTNNHIQLYDPVLGKFFRLNALNAPTKKRISSIAQRLNDGTVLFYGGFDETAYYCTTGTIFTPSIVDYFPAAAYSEGPITRTVHP